MFLQKSENRQKCHLGLFCTHPFKYKFNATEFGTISRMRNIWLRDNDECHHLDGNCNWVSGRDIEFLRHRIWDSPRSLDLVKEYSVLVTSLF